MFQSNIINIYGDRGKAWLEALPQLVQQLSLKLDLCDLKPVFNLTYNYVLSGLQQGKPIILKLGLDSKALGREAYALKCFAKYGAVKVLAADKDMLLLERAVPGISLKSYFPERERGAVLIAASVMQKLYQAKIPENHNFPHLKAWLSALDKDWEIPSVYLQKSRELRNQLLQRAGPEVLMHGDLHHDNILQNSDDWVIIDPKGVIGEAVYEVAAFILNPIPELLDQEQAIQIIQHRIHVFALELEVSYNRIAGWCFVQAILAWIWALEDGCDTRYWEQITTILDRMSGC